MSILLSVTPLQILDLWDELHEAKVGTHKFGGDVIEFYFYRLMPPTPQLGLNPTSSMLDGDFYDAACKLHAMCRLFEERQNVKIVIEGGVSIDRLLEKTDLNQHRVHLRVIH